MFRQEMLQEKNTELAGRLAKSSEQIKIILEKGQEAASHASMRTCRKASPCSEYSEAVTVGLSDRLEVARHHCSGSRVISTFICFVVAWP